MNPKLRGAPDCFASVLQSAMLALDDSSILRGLSHWLWTLAFGHRGATHGYAPTGEAAMAAFAKSWRREWGSDKPCGPGCRLDSEWTAPTQANQGVALANPCPRQL